VCHPPEWVDKALSRKSKTRSNRRAWAATAHRNPSTSSAIITPLFLPQLLFNGFNLDCQHGRAGRHGF
jgi:hypothetical protein